MKPKFEKGQEVYCVSIRDITKSVVVEPFYDRDRHLWYRVNAYDKFGYYYENVFATEDEAKRAVIMRELKNG